MYEDKSRSRFFLTRGQACSLRVLLVLLVIELQVDALRRKDACRCILIGGPRCGVCTRTLGNISLIGARRKKRRRAGLAGYGRFVVRRRPSGVRRGGAVSRGARARGGGRRQYLRRVRARRGGRRREIRIQNCRLSRRNDGWRKINERACIDTSGLGSYIRCPVTTGWSHGSHGPDHAGRMYKCPRLRRGRRRGHQ